MMLKKLTITYEVLAPVDADLETWDIDAIAQNTDYGDASGRTLARTTEVIEGDAVVAACAQHGTDLAFFFPEDDGDEESDPWSTP